jgi:hypothetical protein
MLCNMLLLCVHELLFVDLVVVVLLLLLLLLTNAPHVSLVSN